METPTRRKWCGPVLGRWGVAAASLLALALAGCATAGGFVAENDRWVGRPVKQLVLEKRVPWRRIPAGARGRWLVYYTEREPHFPWQIPHQLGFWCQTDFLIGPGEVVTEYTYRGNDCKSL